MRLDPIIRQLSIRDKQLNVTPLVPNWAQKELITTVEDQLNAGRPGRVIVCKARQLGVSTASEAIGFSLCFLNEGTQALIIAHETEPSQHLLGMSNFYWETYPFKRFYKTKYDSTKTLSWTMGSSLRVSSANNIKSGRGRTIHFLHASEVGFWRNAETTFLGLRQTVPNSPNSCIILESTPNGVGNFFHQQWQAAELGESEYIPLFFPWWKEPSYMASAMDLDYFSLGALDKEERALQAIGLSDDRLAWRRWAIKNLCNNDINQFKQEYPSNPEEGFIQSGTNVFSLASLRECYEPRKGKRGRLNRNKDGSVVFIDDSMGPLTIFRDPSSDTEYGKYMIGADPTATTKGDNACAQVLNRRTFEQVAIWHGKIDPGSFADVLAALGQHYNWATLCPEIEGPGYMTVGKLQGLGYPNIYRGSRPEAVKGRLATTYGWSSAGSAKHIAIGWVIKYLVDKILLIHDHGTLTEMTNYVTLPNGEYGPGNAESYDDRVMALAVACGALVMDGMNPSPYGTNSAPIYAPQPTVQEKIDSAFNPDDGPIWESWEEQNADL